MAPICLLIATIAALSAPAQQESVYSKVVKKPDIRNGYEDYLRAADALDHQAVSIGWNGSGDRYKEMLARKAAASKATRDEYDTWTDEDERSLAVAKEFDGLDVLTARKKLAGRYGAAIDLVKVGNTKRVWDPREKIDTLTLFPELSAFRSVARLITADAYVKFSDGNSSVAVNNLLEGLTFSQRIGGTTVISELVSTACRAIVLASFEEHLGRLSENDTRKIMGHVEAMLKEPSSIIDTWKGERDFMVAGLDSWFTKPEDDYLGDDDDLKQISDFTKKMSPADKLRVKSELKRQMSAMYDRIIKRFDEPESRWAEPIDLNLPPEPDKVETIQDLVDLLTHMLVPTFDQANVSFMRARTQLRLLGLHARVLSYKWHNGRLPANLSEVVPEDQLFDPLSKEAFVYDSRDDSYRLYSKGIASTGPVELKYRRPAGLGQDQGIPPSSVNQR